MILLLAKLSWTDDYKYKKSNHNIFLHFVLTLPRQILLTEDFLFSLLGKKSFDITINFH